MSRFFLFVLVASFFTVLSGKTVGQTMELSLEDIIQRAKEQSTSSKVAATRRENRYWQYRTYKSNFNPQLRLSGNIPNYSKDFYQVVQPDGAVEFRSRQQTNSTVNLGLQQPIPWTGGTVSVNSSVSSGSTM